jgi:hypothetical protein
MFARLNFINQVTGGAADGRRVARRRATSAPLELGTVAQALDYYLPFVLDDNIPDEARALLLEYAGGADAAISEDDLRDLVYLILASPQFHLA